MFNFFPGFPQEPVPVQAGTGMSGACFVHDGTFAASARVQAMRWYAIESRMT